MLARVIVHKFRFGMPFYRQEEQFEADGIELDRGTMARSVEEVGACLGAIVLACADDARKHALCLNTDATGVAIRPEPVPNGKRQPCKRGHFFVVLADRNHIFFEYQSKHTSAAVCETHALTVDLNEVVAKPPDGFAPGDQMSRTGRRNASLLLPRGNLSAGPCNGTIRHRRR
jgi:hypothetical protein